MASLPIPPYVELSGEAGLIAAAFGLAGAALLSASAYIRTKGIGSSSSSSSSSARPRVTRATLLQVLEACKSNVSDSAAVAIQKVSEYAEKNAIRARMNEPPDNLTLTKLGGFIDEAISRADQAVFAREGVTEADLTAALVYYQNDEAVSRSAKSVTSSHPLVLPPREILRLQEEVVRAEVDVHKEAVKASEARGIKPGSREFNLFLVSKMREAGARDISGTGEDSGLSLVGSVLDRNGLEGRELLWTYIVTNAMAGESGDEFKAGFYAIMEKQKQMLRAIGLEVV
jgi:hypothetical protein